MSTVTAPEAAVPWPAPAADDTPVMAAVANSLAACWQVLEQARVLLWIPGEGP